MGFHIISGSGISTQLHGFAIGMEQRCQRKAVYMARLLLRAGYFVVLNY